MISATYTAKDCEKEARYLTRQYGKAKGGRYAGWQIRVTDGATSIVAICKDKEGRIVAMPSCRI